MWILSYFGDWSVEEATELKCAWHKQKQKGEKRKEIKLQVRRLRDLTNFPKIKLSSSVDDLLDYIVNTERKNNKKTLGCELLHYDLTRRFH